MAVKIATPPSKVSIVDTNGYGEINTPLNLPTFAPPLEPPSHIGSFISVRLQRCLQLRFEAQTGATDTPLSRSFDSKSKTLGDLSKHRHSPHGCGTRGLMRFDRKNRTRRVPADSFSDAAREKPSERAFFAPGQNDQIDILLDCCDNNFLRRSTLPCPGFPRDAATFSAERGPDKLPHAAFGFREKLIRFELGQQLRPLIVRLHFTASVLAQPGKQRRMENNQLSTIFFSQREP